jgi:biofilm PGA synthesis protein PgaD
MISEQMCIDHSRHRPAVIRLLEAALTGIAWLAYVGILPWMWSVFVERGAAMGALSRSFPWSAAEAGPGFGPFVMQLAAVALCGSSLLYLWAFYNRQRFRGKDRRRAAVTVTATELADYYGGTPEQIVSLQQERRLFMHHDATGRLTGVHYEEPKRSPAAAADRRRCAGR